MFSLSCSHHTVLQASQTNPISLRQAQSNQALLMLLKCIDTLTSLVQHRDFFIVVLTSRVSEQMLKTGNVLVSFQTLIQFKASVFTTPNRHWLRLDPNCVFVCSHDNLHIHDLHVYS